VGFDPADPENTYRDIWTNGLIPVGVAVDAVGRIWVVNQYGETVSRYDRTLDEIATFRRAAAVHVQRLHRNAAAAQARTGIWMKDYRRCEGLVDRWLDILFDVDAPPAAS